MSTKIEDMRIEDVKHLRDFLLDIDKDNSLSKRPVSLLETLDKILELSDLILSVNRIEYFLNLALKDAKTAESACGYENDYYYDLLECINNDLKKASYKLESIKGSLKRDIYEV